MSSGIGKQSTISEWKSAIIHSFSKRFSDFVYVDTATSWNANDVFNDKWAADNLTSMQNSIVKYEGEIDKIRITNANESGTYKFGIGSRFAIYGR